MSLIIVRKRNSDQDQQRNDRENNNTHDRKCQQCDIEFVILELLQVFYKRIDMFSCLCFFSEAGKRSLHSSARSPGM